MEHFPSLRAFQNAHRNLLQRYRVAEKVTPELQSELEQLLHLGSETGRILDSLPDQRAAQGLLDYWSTVLSREKSDGVGSLLKDFDPNAAPELADENCPYVGLQSVEEGQSGLFLGREESRSPDARSTSRRQSSRCNRTAWLGALLTGIRRPAAGPRSRTIARQRKLACEACDAAVDLSPCGH